MRKSIAIIGNAGLPPEHQNYQLAFAAGKALVDAGYRVQSGGLTGVMEAAFAGAHASKNYREGDTLAILPSFDRTSANAYADIVVPTGLDVMRNAVVINAGAVIAVGGGAGTLSEMAYAWSFGRLLIAYKNAEGWSSRLADTRLDDRVRCPLPDDRVYGVQSAEEMLAVLSEHLEHYAAPHLGIGHRPIQ